MAYVVGTLQTATQATGTSYTVNFPSGVLANDLLLVMLSQDGSTESLAVSASGFTALGTQTESGACSSLWFFKIAAGGETSATFACANDDIIGTAILIRDAHATNPFGSVVDGTDYKRGDWNSANSAASPALTTAADECLLLYAWCSDGSTQYMRCKVDQCIEVDKYASAAINHIIGARQQQTAAAAPTVTMYHPLATEGGNSWVLAVRNKSGGALQPDVRVTGADLKFYGSWIAQHDSVTWQSLDNFAASVNSITCSSVAPTVDNTNAWPSSPYGYYTVLQSTESTTGAWVGGTHAISSTDLTGTVVKIDMASSVVSGSNAAGSDGWLIGFSDGTNWVTYQVKSKAKTWGLQAPESFFMAVGHATAYASSGSINWAAVTRVGYFFHRVGSLAGASQLHVKNLAYFSRFDLTGGGSSRPSAFTDLNFYASGWSHINLTNLQGSAQVKAKVSIQVGDGTNGTYFDGATNAIGFPQAWSASSNSNWQMDWNVNSGQVTLGVYAKSTDTIKLSAGAATSANDQLFTIHASSDTGATYELAQAFGGFSATLKTGITYTGMIFTGGGQIAAKGADLVNCTVKNSTDGTTAAVIGFDANGGSMDGCTTVATTANGYHIELGTAVTDLSLVDHTFSGSALTDKIHVLKTSGTVTITISGTTSLAAGDVTTAGATVVISAPVEYQSVTLSNYVTGSRVQIYDTTNAVELYNDIPAAAPQTLWTDSVAASTSGARDIRVRVAYVSGVTAKQFIEAAIGSVASSGSGIALSYRVNQSADTVYDANGLNGSTIYGSGEITFTDSSPDVINMDMAADTISLPTQYAAWVYYAFTSAGIATDIDYINAIDTANYEYSGIKWKNTSSPTSPLKVTGGYAWDSATLDPMDLIDDTGGTLFLAPAHVVPYATGSGVTPSDVTDIAAASATASAAAIVSAAVDGTTTLAESLRLANAVLGGKVSGAGSTAETFRNLADTKDRMVFTVDSSGNRTAVTRNLT